MNTLYLPRKSFGGFFSLKAWSLLLFFGLSFSFSSFAQMISGTVSSSKDGSTLPGASIVVKGTTVGSITDMNGSYKLDVPEGNNVLIISYLGFVSQEITIDDRTIIDISLKEDLSTLDEVVVVGYGTQKRSDVTGSITGIDSETITERGTTSAIQSLQGSVAGVQISSSTGRVGDGFNITVRGKNTLANSSPLYVVDGIVTDNIDFLNPQDIAKIDILKDAASAAIYGSRASNGVILVETKGGVNIPDGTTFSFESFYGFKKASRLPKMMSLEKWRDYHYSAYLGTTRNGEGMTPEDFNNVVVSEGSNSVLKQRFDNLEGFDWYDAVLKDGMQSNNHISIKHRSGASSYSFGFGYQKETGNIEKESLDKYTLSLNINQKLNDKFKAGSSMSFSFGNNERGSSRAMQEAFRLNPFLTPWALDENNNEIVGEYWPQPGKLRDVDGGYVINKTSTYNPLLEINNSSDEIRSLRGLGNAFLQYNPIDWLTLKSTFSAGFNSNRRGRFSGALTNTGISNSNLASSSLDYYQNFNYTWDNQVNVTKTFDVHSFNLLALQSVFVDRTEGANLASTKQPFETEFYNVGSGLQETYNVGNYFRKNQLASFALRLNYSLQDKYLLTVSNRWDGSSLLSDGNKWEAFPSVAVAWKLSKEAFISDIESISNLKLRVGYGTTGNNNVDPYSTVNTLTDQTYYDFNGTTANGWIPTTIANKSLTWEKTQELNIGLDFALFNYRVNGSIDWYDRLSDDLLVSQKLPSETGYASITANAASVKNTGIEMMLSTTNVKTQLVTWETIFTFTKNVNTIESIYGQSEVDDVGNGWFIGESIDAHYNYKFNGIWQADENAEEYNQTEGQAKVVDVNNDGKIDPNDDRMILGSSNPSWTGGLISRLQVGDFDMNVTLSTQQGILAFSNYHRNFEDVRDRGRQKADISDWYIPSNGVGVPAQVSNSYPQPRNGGTFWRSNGVGYYKDASFVKVNNISVGYTVPQSILDKAKIQHLRVYVNVLNPFVFTDYTGWDPEWAEASLGVGRVSNTTTQIGLSLKF